MNQHPRATLPGIFPTASGIVVFDSAVYIISLPDIKFAAFPALEDIDVIYNCFFRTNH
jgi:hypothetical protein